MVKRAERVEMRWKKEQMYVSMYSYYYYCCCYCEGGIEQIQKYRHEAYAHTTLDMVGSMYVAVGVV